MKSISGSFANALRAAGIAVPDPNDFLTGRPPLWAHPSSCAKPETQNATAGIPVNAAQSQPEIPNPEHERSANGAQRETRNTEPETSASAAPPQPQRDCWTPFLARTGRPTIFTPELVTVIYENIKRYGFSDTSAAHSAGVSSSTVSRWKQEIPNFGEFLADARDAFEIEHLHRIEVFKRKDGQCDPFCSRWLLERSNPEKYGRRSAARKSKPGTQNSKPETSSKPPRPGTPEFWATVEEEPLPRNLSTCTMTPGRLKFYSTIHLVSMPYKPDIDPNEPTVIPTPEAEEAEMEAFFRLQEAYFALPKAERLPFLHSTLEQEFGKVLSPEQRAATDALIKNADASAIHQDVF